MANDPGSSGFSWRVQPQVLPVPTRAELARRGLVIGRVVARRLGPMLLQGVRHPRSAPRDPHAYAHPVRLAFQDLGGTFVKFGQLVASSPGLFGDQLSEEFRDCLDTGPAVAPDQIRSTIEEGLSMGLTQAFASFDFRPVGRASIAVVHRAVLHDGRVVAVKVLRPGIERAVATDLALMGPLFAALSRLTGTQVAGAAVQQIDGLRVQVAEELDLRNEARALVAFRALIAAEGFDALCVPEPVLDRSGRRVLTMEYLDGVAIDDLAAAASMGVDPVPLVDQLIRSFFTLVVLEGVFHGDVHAGNLMILRDGRLGIIDWGIVGRLDERTHRFLLRLLAGVLGEQAAWRDVTAYFVESYGPQLRDALGMDDAQLAAFLQTMIEPVLLRPFGEFSLGEMLLTTQARAATASGIELQRGGMRGAIQRFRVERRLHRAAVAGGGLQSEFDRQNFLLGKQLMYFERYGKMFLADAPILADRPFVSGLLEEAARRDALRDAGPSLAG